MTEKFVVRFKETGDYYYGLNTKNQPISGPLSGAIKYHSYYAAMTIAAMVRQATGEVVEVTDVLHEEG